MCSASAISVELWLRPRPRTGQRCGRTDANDAGRKKLRGTADGRVPREHFVYLVAQKKRRSNRRARCSTSWQSLAQFPNRPANTGLKNTTRASESCRCGCRAPAFPRRETPSPPTRPVSGPYHGAGPAPRAESALPLCREPAFGLAFPFYERRPATEQDFRNSHGFKSER